LHVRARIVLCAVGIPTKKCLPLTFQSVIYLEEAQWQLNHEWQNPICIIFLLYLFLFILHTLNPNYFYKIDTSLVIFINKYFFWRLHIDIVNVLLIDFYLLKLLLKLSWFYWAIVVSISGHKIVLRICKLCLWTLLIYYRQLSFCEFASIHGSKSFPTMLRTDKKTNQADYRSDFPSLENLQLPAKCNTLFWSFPVCVKVES